MAFNWLVAPNLDLQRNEIQFSHSEDRAYEYRLGDKVWWPDKPLPWALGELDVPGIGSGNDGAIRYFEIRIVQDEIKGFREIAERDWEDLNRRYLHISRTRLT